MSSNQKIRASERRPGDITSIQRIPISAAPTTMSSMSSNGFSAEEEDVTTTYEYELGVHEVPPELLERLKREHPEAEFQILDDVPEEDEGQEGEEGEDEKISNVVSTELAMLRSKIRSAINYKRDPLQPHSSPGDVKVTSASASYETDTPSGHISATLSRLEAVKEDSGSGSDGRSSWTYESSSSFSETVSTTNSTSTVLGGPPRIEFFKNEAIGPQTSQPIVELPETEEEDEDTEEGEEYEEEEEVPKSPIDKTQEGLLKLREEMDQMDEALVEEEEEEEVPKSPIDKMQEGLLKLREEMDQMVEAVVEEEEEETDADDEEGYDEEEDDDEDAGEEDVEKEDDVTKPAPTPISVIRQPSLRQTHHPVKVMIAAREKGIIAPPRAPAEPPPKPPVKQPSPEPSTQSKPTPLPRTPSKIPTTIATEVKVAEEPLPNEEDGEDKDDYAEDGALELGGGDHDDVKDEDGGVKDGDGGVENGDDDDDDDKEDDDEEEDDDPNTIEDSQSEDEVEINSVNQSIKDLPVIDEDEDEEEESEEEDESEEEEEMETVKEVPRIPITTTISTTVLPRNQDSVDDVDSSFEDDEDEEEAEESGEEAGDESSLIDEEGDEEGDEREWKGIKRVKSVVAIVVPEEMFGTEEEEDEDELVIAAEAPGLDDASAGAEIGNPLVALDRAVMNLEADSNVPSTSEEEDEDEEEEAGDDSSLIDEEGDEEGDEREWKGIKRAKSVVSIVVPEEMFGMEEEEDEDELVIAAEAPGLDDAAAAAEIGNPLAALDRAVMNVEADSNVPSTSEEEDEDEEEDEEEDDEEDEEDEDEEIVGGPIKRTKSRVSIVVPEEIYGLEEEDEEEEEERSAPPLPASPPPSAEQNDIKTPGRRGSSLEQDDHDALKSVLGNTPTAAAKPSAKPATPPAVSTKPATPPAVSTKPATPPAVATKPKTTPETASAAVTKPQIPTVTPTAEPKTKTPTPTATSTPAIQEILQKIPPPPLEEKANKSDEAPEPTKEEEDTSKPTKVPSVKRTPSKKGRRKSSTSKENEAPTEPSTTTSSNSPSKEEVIYANVEVTPMNKDASIPKPLIESGVIYEAVLPSAEVAAAVASPAAAATPETDKKKSKRKSKPDLPPKTGVSAGAKEAPEGLAPGKPEEKVPAVPSAVNGVVIVEDAAPVDESLEEPEEASPPPAAASKPSIFQRMTNRKTQRKKKSPFAPAGEKPVEKPVEKPDNEEETDVKKPASPPLYSTARKSRRKSKEETPNKTPSNKVTPPASPNKSSRGQRYNVRKGKLEAEVDAALEGESDEDFEDFGKGLNGQEPPLRSSTPEHLNRIGGSPTSPKTPLSPENESSETSGLEDESMLEPHRTLFTQTSLVESVLEEVDDGGVINRSLRNPYIRDDLITHHILHSVDKLIYIVGGVNKCSKSCLALQETISLLEPLCGELEVQWKNLSRRKRRHLDLYLACLVQWLDVVEQVLLKCAIDIPKYQVFHHLLRAVKGVGFRKKLVDANLKIRSAEQHLVTAMITCNLQVSANCRSQVFEDLRGILDEEGAMIKKQLANSAQELYEKQLQMERKIITKLRKKEKKIRAAVNADEEEENVSEEVPDRVEDLILDTQPKQELATITEAEEQDENDNSEIVSREDKAKTAIKSKGKA